MTTRAESLKVLVVTLTLALTASLLVLVGPLTNKALSQTTPSGTIDPIPCLLLIPTTTVVSGMFRALIWVKLSPH